MRRLIRQHTRYVYRVVLLLLILSMALSATGCGWNSDKYKFEIGHFDYTFTPDSIMMGAKSKTDTFAKDAVSVELYYGVHNIGYDERYGTDPKSRYTLSAFPDEKILFALYVCDTEFSLDVVNSMNFEDYKNIDNYYFVKEIFEDEAFSEEYGFNMTYLQGVTYNHHETITIPAELLNKEKGSFSIKILAFQGPLSDSGIYHTTNGSHIELDYEIVDDKVKIKFEQ